MMQNNEATVQIKKKSVYRARQKRIDSFCLVMMIGPFIQFVLFWLIVNLESFVMPFQDDKTGSWTWDNFRYIFTLLGEENSPLLLNLRNTVLSFLTNMFAGYVVGLIFAYFIHRKLVGYKAFSIIFMLPEILSSVVLVAIYKNVFSVTGPLSRIYQSFSGKMFPNLLYDAKTATPMILCYVLFTGFCNNLILFSGTMSTVSEEIYESATLDGAGDWRMMLSITLPIIAPTIWIMLLFSSMSVFGSSGPVLLFTEGMYETSTFSYWFYERAILAGEKGIPSALGLLMSIANLPFLCICLYVRIKMMKGEESLV